MTGALPHLVIEVGGTTLRAARYEPGAGLGPVVRVPSPNHLDRSPEAAQRDVIDLMVTVGRQVLDGQPPARVSIAYPGPVTPAGEVLAAPTLLGRPGRPFPLLAACRDRWPAAQVNVMNDLAAAGYRHVARGERDFCILTVGSGIGHKVFLAGRPVIGAHGYGGELGHLLVDPAPDALPCDCGATGHLGGVASGRGVLAAVHRVAAGDGTGRVLAALGASTPAEITNEAVIAAYHADDGLVAPVVATAAAHVGRALAGAHLLIGLERFILVGGFALAAGEPYRATVARGAAASTWDLGAVWDDMVVLGHEDDASGLVGAALADGTDR